jgi:DNA repair protein RadC
MREKIYSKKESDLYLDKPREYVLKIKDLPAGEQPREKLSLHGPAHLTQQELLSVVLNAGNRQENVAELSNRIVKEYGERSIFAEKNVKKLSEDLKIPFVKACQIVACGELGRRLYEKNESGLVSIRTAEEVFNYLLDMRNLSREQLRGLYLNSHNRIVHDEVISIGTLTTSIVHPREVFRPAIEYGTVAIVLAHNHPSGSATPSDADIEVTKQLVEAGKIIGIHILDHVIITKSTFASIKIRY